MPCSTITSLATHGTTVAWREDGFCIVRFAWGVGYLRVDALSPLHLAWPDLLPSPSVAQEMLLQEALFASPNRRHWASTEPREFEALPAGRQQRIVSAAAALGFALSQALSLRNAVLKCELPQLWDSASAQAMMSDAGVRFEDQVEAFLRAQGVPFETQAQQLARQAAARALDPSAPSCCTPDFLLPHPVLLNGAEVRWIEVKCFYACATRKGLRAWAPTRKAEEQASKYSARFGPGAMVFSQGFSSDYLRRLPGNVCALGPPPSPAQEAASSSEGAERVGGGGGGGSSST